MEGSQYTNTGPSRCGDEKVRDAYVRFRFPGLLTRAADLGRAERVIVGARRYFGEGRVVRALELLEMATQARPDLKSLWIARLELLLLADADEEFLEAARSFTEAHPCTGLGDEIALLARSLRAATADGGRERIGSATGAWLDPNEHFESMRLAAEIHGALAPAGALPPTARKH